MVRAGAASAERTRSSAVIQSEDDAAVRRCLAGDREAFTELVERYKRPLYATAFRLLGDPGLAEDAVQETFLRAYRGLARFRVGEPMAPWLYRIITNLCSDLGRARGRQALNAQDEELERRADPADGPEAVLERRETRAMVLAAIAELPEMYRVLVVLAHQQGLNYEEICQVTGEPLTIVKNRLFRARQMLRRSLADHQGGGAAHSTVHEARGGFETVQGVRGGASNEV